MTVKELRTGDIIVLRNGTVGFYVEKDNEGYILYGKSGFDCISIYNDDLTDGENGPEFDIMRAYRAEGAFIYYNDF